MEYKTTSIECSITALVSSENFVDLFVKLNKKYTIYCWIERSLMDWEGYAFWNIG